MSVAVIQAAKQGMAVSKPFVSIKRYSNFADQTSKKASSKPAPIVQPALVVLLLVDSNTVFPDFPIESAVLIDSTAKPPVT